MIRLVIALCIAVLVAPLAIAQPMAAEDRLLVAQQKPRTLFDLLFGPDDNQPAQRANPPTVRRPATRTAPQTTTRGTSRPARQKASLPPAKPDVEKAENATRLAVFGDSLAIDLARALERAYADDPNLVVLSQGVGSSGFVRDDFFDWNKAIGDAIAGDSFDIAVVIIGINDRQPIRENGHSYQPLTDQWKTIYSARIAEFLGQLQAAAKPVIWVGLPPMQARSYSAAISQIASVQKLAAFSGGAEYVDIYERFIDEAGNFSAYGPDLNGDNVLMRKSDGIHFSNAGSDKLAFYVNQSLKFFYSGGSMTVEIADVLAGTDAAAMQRPPFQGLGQIRLLQVASPVVSLNDAAPKALDLVLSMPQMSTGTDTGFDFAQMVEAPAGRADAFGVGVTGETRSNPRGR